MEVINMEKSIANTKKETATIKHPEPKKPNVETR
jgi:hypothetical protein